MVKAELVYNPYAGQVVVWRELDDVLSLLRKHGWVIDIREVRRPGEATEYAREAVKRCARVVVAAGGDGTVSEVARGLVGTDVALGVLPIGTTNVWALQMRIPALNPMLPTTGIVRLMAALRERISRPLPADYYRRMLLKAARVLIEGRRVAVDVGEVDGHYFLMWVGVGLDAAITDKISLGNKKVSGSWAYLKPALWTLPRYHTTDICMRLDDKITQVKSNWVVVSNIQLYAGMFQLGAKARVNDGRLDVCVFKGEGVFTFLHHAFKVLGHRHLKDSRIDYHQCSQIVLESARPLPVHLDGDPFGYTPVTIRTVPSALQVIVPQKAPVKLFDA